MLDSNWAEVSLEYRLWRSEGLCPSTWWVSGWKLPKTILENQQSRKKPMYFTGDLNFIFISALIV